jgi:hypothetical protein
MARARASLAISEPEFDEAWPEDIATARRVPPRLVVAPGGAYGEPTPPHGEPTPPHGEPTPAHGEPTPAHGEPTRAYGESTAIEPTVGAGGAPAAAAAVPRGTAVPGRRTVTIRGQVAPRPAPRRPRRDPYDRVGARPDRIAMWAVLLCVLLVLVAATSSHAAVLHTALQHLALHAHP